MMISPKADIEFLLPSSDQDRSRYFRLLGLLPLLFFLAQGIHYWRINELGHMLWICNIANLVLAVGLFRNHVTLIRIATLWMIPGLVVWFLYVVLAWGVFLTSTLAHVGGVLVAMLALRKIGMDRHSWLYSVGGYLVVQLLSRPLTPVAFNVNLSQAVYDGWETSFDSYWTFWLVSTFVAAMILWGVGIVLRKLWPASSPLQLTVAAR